jgi:hypothetical protein
MSARLSGSRAALRFWPSPSHNPIPGRVLLPTTRHLFLVLLFCALFVLATREITDPDFWWHLRTGEYIVENGSVPHTDIFSFTSSDKEWVTHEWLAEVFIYLLFRAGGFALLIVTFAGVITAAFALAFWRCNARPFLAGFVVLLGALASAPTWGVRPQMLSVLLTSIFLFLLDRYHEEGAARWVMPLVPLTMLWVNLHSGFAIGLVLMAGYLLGILVERARIPRNQAGDRTLRILAFVFMLCIASVMVNPNGARMYSYPFETLTSPAMQKYIQEWFSPDFHLVEFQPFGLMLIALIGSALWSHARVPSTSILLILVFAYASLRSARNIPIFALVAIPVLTQQLAEGLRGSRWLHGPTSRTGTPRALGILNSVLMVVLFAIVGFRIYNVTGNQSAVERATFPTEAVAIIQNQKPPPSLYNSYSWGGYLVWKLYPDYRVYIDGRADVYGDDFIEDFLRIYRAEPAWSEQLAKRDVRLVLIEPDAPLALALVASPDWQRVYADDHSALFERK